MKFKNIFRILLISFVVAGLPVNAKSRIKDMATVQGIRDNQLIGYGLVVGLPGTGEKAKQGDFTSQSFSTMLKSFGITIPSGGPQFKVKNIAPVAVTAKLPAFGKSGQSIDVTVSALGEAKSLRGGTLLQTFLKGVDGRTYALAQGSLVVGGFGAEGADGSSIVVNTPTVGRIPDGGIIEQEIKSPFAKGDFITFNLKRPDFTSANNLAKAVNDFLGDNTAKAIDSTSVKVYAPRDPSQRVSFLSVLENIEFDPAVESARIVVNSRTGTIVVGSQVKLLPTAITHGGLTIKVSETPVVSQPNELANGRTVNTKDSDIEVTESDSRMFKFDTGTTLDDLVNAVNSVGVAPGDLVSILEALKQAGAIQGDLIVI